MAERSEETPDSLVKFQVLMLPSLHMCLAIVLEDERVKHHLEVWPGAVTEVFYFRHFAFLPKQLDSDATE